MYFRTIRGQNIFQIVYTKISFCRIRQQFVKRKSSYEVSLSISSADFLAADDADDAD